MLKQWFSNGWIMATANKYVRICITAQSEMDMNVTFFCAEEQHVQLLTYRLRAYVKFTCVSYLHLEFLSDVAQSAHIQIGCQEIASSGRRNSPYSQRPTLYLYSCSCFNRVTDFSWMISRIHPFRSDFKCEHNANRITRLIFTIAFCRNLIAKQCTEFSTSIGKVCFFIAWILSNRSLFSVLPSHCLAELIAFCNFAEREHAFLFRFVQENNIIGIKSMVLSTGEYGRGRLIHGSLAFVNRKQIMKCV